MQIETTQCEKCGSALGKKKTSFTGLIYKKCSSCKTKVTIGERRYILPASIAIQAFFLFMYLEDMISNPRMWTQGKFIMNIVSSVFFWCVLSAVVTWKIFTRRNLKKFAVVSVIITAIAAIIPSIIYKARYNYPENSAQELIHHAETEFIAMEQKITSREFNAQEINSQINKLDDMYNIAWSDQYLTKTNGDAFPWNLLIERRKQLKLLTEIVGKIETGAINQNTPEMIRYTESDSKIRAIYASFGRN